MVLTVCRDVLRNEADAEDAFQATFLILARKAGSIRKAESLGSWLHGVAYRVALKAKTQLVGRQRREALAPARPAPEADDLTWREVRQVLHEELSGLPERYRLPLILCYLEGKTQAEAAAQTGLPKGTLKGRLERGRKLLRARLTRRGLGPAVLLVAAALPNSLVGSTVKAAAPVAAGQAANAGAVSAQVAALSEGGLKAMLFSKLQIPAALLAVGLLFAGAGLGRLAGDGPEQYGQAKKPPADSAGEGRRPAEPKKVADVAPDPPDRVSRLSRLPAELLKGPKRSDADLVDALFLATLMRPPAEAEKGLALKHLKDAQDREKACRDVLWALVNSREFVQLHGLGKDIKEALGFVNKIGEAWEKKK